MSESDYAAGSQPGDQSVSQSKTVDTVDTARDTENTASDRRGFAGGGVQRSLSLVARLALGAVLLVAGGLKIGDPNEAITAVTAYQLLPTEIATIVGYGLPFFEILIGLLLIVGLATRAAAATTAVLMIVFILAVSSAWARGLSIDCGCFGGGGQTEDPQYLPEIMRDLLFLGLASWLMVFPASRWALDATGLLGTGDTGFVDELLDGEEDTSDDESVDDPIRPDGAPRS